MVSLFAGASASGSKSTVLKPLQWLLGLVLAAMITAAGSGAPALLVVMLAVLSTVAFIANLWAYTHFARVDPDALRSERFNIAKMQIEKGLLGDNVSGFKNVTVDPISARAALPAATETDQVIDTDKE